MKVLFITNIPSPYRIDFYNELNKYVDVTVIFEARSVEGIHFNWRTDFKFTPIFLSDSVIHEKSLNLNIFRHLKNVKYDFIFLTNYSYLTEMFMAIYMAVNNKPYILEVDGLTRNPTESFIKRRLKRFLISNASDYFSPSIESDKALCFYGAKPECIHRYYFTSLFKSDIIHRPLLKHEKKLLREQLNLTEERILISVGRFSYLDGYGKGFDTLLKICEQLPDNIGVYIIGDEPTEEFVKWKEEKHLNQVHYLPFISRDDLFKYYKAADLSVLLTRGDVWGLVINESLANGTPVITTDACVAGLELIQNGRNGYIVPVDSVEKTIEIIVDIINDEKKKYNMSCASIDIIKDYTIEKMAEVHKSWLNKNYHVCEI